MALERTTQEHSGGVTVEQFVALAQTLVHHPELYATLAAVAEKIEVAKAMGWTGKVEINILSGVVSGGPTIKAS
jgi:hypothetical protein